MPPASAWTDAAKDNPPTPAPNDGESGESNPRYYDLPIPSQMAIPNDYEHDEDDEKDENFEGGDISVKEAR